MVGRVHRAGHSLPELIVAVTFLAATAAAVGNLAVFGARRTAEAVGRQHAVRTAEIVLDSLVAAPPAAVGGTVRGGHAVRWAPDGDDWIRVIVSPRTGAGPPVTLRGRVVPDVPVLPDEAPDSVERFVTSSSP